MAEGWALFTTYSGQVCQLGKVVAQEAVALGPCLAQLDAGLSGTVMQNYKQLYVATGSQFSIITYYYAASDQCAGIPTGTKTDGPHDTTTLGCYNQVFTKGPTDPNALLTIPSSSTFLFIPGLNGGYNIPEFNFTGVIFVSFSEPCTLKSTPTSVRVYTDECMKGSGSSLMFQCAPSFSKSTYEVTKYTGSSSCCPNGDSCMYDQSFPSYFHCRTALTAYTTDSRYLYQNQSCTNSPWPTSPPAPLPPPTNSPWYFPIPRIPTKNPSTGAVPSSRLAASPPKTLTMMPVIIAVTTVVPTVLYLFYLFYLYYRGRLVFRRRADGVWVAHNPANDPAPATAVPRVNARTSGIIGTTAAVTNPIMIEPLEVEAVLVRPRGGGTKLGERDSLAGVPVVEAYSVEHVDHIPSPSAPPKP